MRIKLEQLPERYKQQVLKQIGNTSSDLFTKHEQNTGDEQVAEKETTRCDGSYSIIGSVRVTYRDFRRRLLDADNGFSKFFTDAIVSCGAIQDDSPRYIPERPKVTQEKSKEEELIITVEKL